MTLWRKALTDLLKLTDLLLLTISFGVATLPILAP